MTNGFQNYWNIMLATDSYKATHWNMLPSKLKYAESYAEARGGEYTFTTFFGMQYYIQSFLVGVQVTEEKIQEAVEFYNQHFGVDNVFNEAGWRYILEKYDGKLPLKIESVKEGSVVPVKNILYKMSSTDENCVWLVNWVETLMMKLWYPITIATNSMLTRSILEYHAEQTGDNTNVDFLMHDFGYRGVASEEQAWLGGAAHLLTFRGSDTIAGIRMLQKYYNAPMCGFSVPASEHMVMTLEGRDNEVETYRRIIKAHGKGTKYESIPLSLVSDTYDIFGVTKFIHSDVDIRNMILDRPGPFVLRPDSGDAYQVLKECLEILSETFGYTTNEKGFKTINKIRLLQGDGINNSVIHMLLGRLAEDKWSIDNFIFGSGGALLQKFDRDTIKFAIKCSYAIVGDREVDVYKDPITDSGKTSKKGKLRLMRTESGYVTRNHYEADNETDVSALQTVFFNGVLQNQTTYTEILEHYKNELNNIA